jgi:hypothetical protein
MSELDMYHTIRPSDVIKVHEGVDGVADINDFVSGMSAIEVGIKPFQIARKGIDLAALSEQSEPEDIDIVDIV